MLLCIRYQAIRKTTALRLYEALTLYGEDMDVADEDLMIILTQLNATDWEQSVEQLRPIRNHFCQLMKVPAPVPQKKS